jgi:membrane protein YdbS with pleckstrin-like domain
MSTLTNRRWAIALLAVWLVVFLIFLLLWFVVGPGWWATAMCAVVIAVAVFFTIRLSPFQPVSRNAGQHSEKT